MLTDEAVLSCVVYVDLNPIRAKMTDTPEASDHTSIEERIAPQFNLGEAIHRQIEQQGLRHFELTLKNQRGQTQFIQILALNVLSFFVQLLPINTVLTKS